MVLINSFNKVNSTLLCSKHWAPRGSNLTLLGRSADSQNNKEVVGLRLTYFNDGEFSDVKPELLQYDGEKDYYKKIENQLREKMLDNHCNDQDKSSRRIIYHDDSCISLAHFLIRDQIFDAKFFLRSSNVKRQAE